MQEEHKHKKKKSIPVRVALHARSPFTIFLDQKNPLEEEEAPAPFVRLNFLDAEPVQISTSGSGPSSDLTLTQEDVQDQLIETALAWKKTLISPHVEAPVIEMSIKQTSPIAPFQPTIQNITYTAQEHTPVPEPEQESPSSCEEESSALFFDLPEAEDDDEPESELVLFDEIILDLASETPSQKHTSQPIVLFSWKRSLVMFVVVALILTSPISFLETGRNILQAKEAVPSTAKQALASLEHAGKAAEAANIPEAQAAFEAAETHFSTALRNLESLGITTQALLTALPQTHRQLKAATSLLVAGKALSKAGVQLTDGFAAVQSTPITTPTARLRLVHTYLEQTLPLLSTAVEAIGEADASLLPEDEQTKLIELQKTAPTLLALMKDLTNVTEVGARILGGEGTRRYILLFQNNTELRATGGFIGSFAEIQVTDGTVSKLIVPEGGSYDLQGQLRRELTPPKPLQLLRNRWEFQDANYFPDFPTSARLVTELYEASGGPTVDGVIAVNATYIADILSLLGPVDLSDEYGRVITKENFLEETQKIVELEYDKEENKPKAFIGDLAPILLERAFAKTTEDFFGLLEHVSTGLREREIQLYLRDNEEQKELRRLGFDGSIRPSDRDYLMVVGTNLGGGKTDLSIEEDVHLDVEISEEGTITNTVTIERRHFGEAKDLFANTNNVTYLRLYVPKGSTLVHASGFAIPSKDLFEAVSPKAEVVDDLYYTLETESTDSATETAVWEEAGKTVFGNWVQTKPGSTTTTTFTYTLPFSYASLTREPTRSETLQRWLGFTPMDHYSLLVQHQAGSRSRHTSASIHLPTTLAPTWSSEDGSHMDFPNVEDGVYSTLLAPGKEHAP